MPGARRGERAGDAGPFFCRGRGETGTETLAARIGADLPASLRIHKPEHARVRELLLARVADLDRDDLVPPGQIEQRAFQKVKAAMQPNGRGSGGQSYPNAKNARQDELRL